MSEFWMVGHTPQCVAADMTFADMPVSIHPRVVRCARVIEVNGADIPGLHRALKFIDQCFKAILFTDVVTGGESVRRIETNTEVEFGHASMISRKCSKR